MAKKKKNNKFPRSLPKGWVWIKLGIKGNRLKRIVNILDILYKGKKFVKEMIGGKR